MGGLRREVLAATGVLASAGLRSPRVDAELLIAEVLGVPRSGLLLAADLSSAQQQRVARLVNQRASGIPLQYLLGRAPFRYLELAVGPGVFIPRPETELVIELAAASLASASSVVDLCSGSGALAIAAACEYPGVAVLAVERSRQAAVWLHANVAASGAGARIEELVSDIADPRVLAGRRGSVDVVLANPPYVPTALRSVVPAEVLLDPDEAVFGGDDGLSVIPSVVAVAAELLKPGGQLVMEHDDSHQPAVLAMLDTQTWQAIQAHDDLAGRPRFISARRGPRRGVRQDGGHE